MSMPSDPMRNRKRTGSRFPWDSLVILLLSFVAIVLVAEKGLVNQSFWFRFELNGIDAKIVASCLIIILVAFSTLLIYDIC
jgi:hypothetical protein